MVPPLTSRLANQEHCIEVGPSKDGGRDVRAVGHIAMELMQKFSRDDGTIGVEDLNRWPSSSHAVGFLSETTSAHCVTELIQVRRTRWFESRSNGCSILLSSPLGA